jgi:hypothetical protein
MGKFIIRIAIIAAVIGGGFVLRDRLSSAPGDLKVGDCFDVPAADIDISDVQHHPCSETHTGEVIFVGNHPAPKGTTFTDDLLIEFGGTTCVAAAETYVGSTLPGELDLGAFYPTDEDWATGDRGITCYLYRVDDGPMTESLKAA